MAIAPGLVVILALAQGPGLEPAVAAEAGAEAALPEANALVDRLLLHQRRVDEVREGYTYKAREVEYSAERRRDGVRWKKKQERVWQIFPSRRLQLQRLVEKDGRPLTEKEEREEDERLQKQIREWEKRKEKREREKSVVRQRVEPEGRTEPQPEPEPGPEPEAKPKPEAGPESEATGDGEMEPTEREVRLRDLLRATVLTTVGREWEEGRRLLVIDFAGNPGFKAKSRAEKLAQRLEGRMWIDEDDLQIARAEARLGKFNIGAGGWMAKLQSARLYFEQQRLAGTLWLPVRAEAEYRAKVLLVKGIDGRTLTDFYDYQRYGTATEISFGGPLGDEDCPEDDGDRVDDAVATGMHGAQPD